VGWGHGRNQLCNFLKIGSGVPELEDPEKWHLPLKAFIALTTVLRYCADCDNNLGYITNLVHDDMMTVKSRR